MILGATVTMLVGTLAACVLLLGRFTLMVIGFFLFFSTLITLQQEYLSGWQGVAVLVIGLLCLLAGRPSWLRRGHRARTTRQDAQG